MIDFLSKLFRRRSKDERGATTVMVAVSLSLLLFAATAALDIGLQRTQTRDMQALADIGALDLSRRIDGVKTSQQLAPTMAAALNRTVVRNKANDASITTSYTLGRISTTGQFTAVAATAVPTAVKVTAAETGDWAFSDRTETSTRTAIASATTAAGGDCFRLGSYEGLLGTSGARAINPFFQKLISQSTIFGNPSAASNYNWEMVAAEKINMTGVASRMGYASVGELQASSVNLKALYRAIYDQVRADSPSSITASASGTAWSLANNVPAFPMDKILGKGVVGTVNSNSLDILGGIAAYYNTRGRSVNPYFGSDIPYMQNAGGAFSYEQGARQFCGKAGDTFTTQSDLSVDQMQLTTHGGLNPITYSTRFTAPGLMDAPYSLTGPNDVNIDAQVDPISMTIKSVTCTPTTKTVAFDLSSGDMDFGLGNGNAWYVGSSGKDIITRLTGYGAKDVRIAFGVRISFKAHFEVAPSTNNMLTTTKETLGKPIYLPNSDSRMTIDTSQAMANFDYLQVRWADYSWPDINVSAADQLRIKQAIVRGIVNPLMDRTNPQSLLNVFMAPMLGAGGASVNGPSVIFDGTDIVCGSTGGKTVVKLVG